MKRFLIASVTAVVMINLLVSYLWAQETDSPGKLLITVKPVDETKIFLNRELIAGEGVASEILPPGEYRITVVHPDFQALGEIVFVFENQITVVEVDLANRRFIVKGSQAPSPDPNTNRRQVRTDASDTTGMFSIRGAGGFNIGVGENGTLTTDFHNKDITFQPGNSFSLSGSVRYGVTSFLDAEIAIGSALGLESAYEDSAAQSGLLINLDHVTTFDTLPIGGGVIGKWPIGELVPYIGVGIDLHLSGRLTEDVTLSSPGYYPLSIERKYYYDPTIGFNTSGGVEYFFQDLFSLYGELKFFVVGYKITEVKSNTSSVGLSEDENFERNQIKDDFFFKDPLITSLGLNVGIAYWFDSF